MRSQPRQKPACTGRFHLKAQVVKKPTSIPWWPESWSSIRTRLVILIFFFFSFSSWSFFLWESHTLGAHWRNWNNCLCIFKRRIKTDSEIKASLWPVHILCVSMKDLSAPKNLLVLNAQLIMPSLTLVLLILPCADGTRCNKPIFCTMWAIAKSSTNPKQESNARLKTATWGRTTTYLAGFSSD